MGWKDLFGQGKALDTPKVRIVNGKILTDELVSESNPPVPSKEVKQESKVVEAEQVSAEQVADPVHGSEVARSEIDQFWIALQSAGKAKGTMYEYRIDFRWWKKQTKSKDLKDIKVEDIEKTLRSVHPSTARRKVAFLRRLARFFMRGDDSRLFIAVGKFESPRIPKRLPGDLGPEEFTRLRYLSRDWCMTKSKKIKGMNRKGIWVGLMLMCGLRISEIATLKIKGNDSITVLGKGNKQRLLPVSDWLILALRKNKRDGRGGWEQQRKLIWEELKNEGIKHPHSLRHTFACECLRRGKSIVEIQQLLGHENIATTNIYARLEIPKDVAAILDKEN